MAGAPADPSDIAVCLLGCDFRCASRYPIRIRLVGARSQMAVYRYAVWIASSARYVQRCVSVDGRALASAFVCRTDDRFRFGTLDDGEEIQSTVVSWGVGCEKGVVEMDVGDKKSR